ncbi:MAG: hypothetical protein FJ045_06215 [Crenarchaeota archaeon]|nr:hypothetical protein [Thermoproteota archaeon]
MRQEKPVTRGYLDKSLEKLAIMVKRGFDGTDKQFVGVNKSFEGNRREHQLILNRLDKIDRKLEGVVYRQEFDEVKARLKIVEEALAIK